MTTADLAKKIARAQYSLISRPLHAADRVARHLPADSPARTTVERGVSALNAAAERLFGTSRPASAQALTDLHTRASGGVESDAQLEQADDVASDHTDSRTAHGESTATAPHASERANLMRDGAATRPHVGEVDRVAEELLEDLDEAPLAGELAEAPEDEKKRMADLRAKHLVEEFEAEQRARHARFQDS